MTPRRFSIWILLLVVALVASALATLRARARGDDHIQRDMDLPIEKPEPAPPPGPPASPVQPPVVAVLPPKFTPPPIEQPKPTFFGQELRLPKGGAIYYVIDISGSMGYPADASFIDADGEVQTGGTRLDHAKSELIRSVKSLPEEAVFCLEAYDCSVRPWPNGFQKATNQWKSCAETWIKALVSNGATGTGPAVVNALAYQETKLVVLLSDGAPNCGAGSEDGTPACIEAHRSQIKWGNTNHVPIQTFGIHATGEFKQFLMDVASDSCGTYTDAR